MSQIKTIPGTVDSILSSLRALYGRYGYSKYKMNKFEEYDLYARNKDFLISDSVITFTDGNGKLLALKPDVTLSIVKNSRDDLKNPQKLYYNENVYRVAKGGRNFKEIMQVGLECIGNVDRYCVYEVLNLALGSLELIGRESVLCVSHLGVLSGIMDNIGVPADKKDTVFRFIGEKNLHELTSALSDMGIDGEKIGMLKNTVNLSGKVSKVLPELESSLRGVIPEETLSEFVGIMTSFKDENAVAVDFSVVGDIHYYNGFVFKGYVNGIPSSVLSGGQYDTLMKRMGRLSSAIGFAVYLDTIEQLFLKEDEYDVDIVLLYDGASDNNIIGDTAKKLMAEGNSVLACREIPDGLKYKKIVNMKDREAE